LVAFFRQRYLIFFPVHAWAERLQLAGTIALKTSCGDPSVDRTNGRRLQANTRVGIEIQKPLNRFEYAAGGIWDGRLGCKDKCRLMQFMLTESFRLVLAGSKRPLHSIPLNQDTVGKQKFSSSIFGARCLCFSATVSKQLQKYGS
jgi:hypothetical protein